MTNGFINRASRDEYRRILIQVERATDAVQECGISDEKRPYLVRLMRGQIAAQRLLMDALDAHDPPGPPELDFDTDLRIMLDAGEENTTTEGAS